VGRLNAGWTVLQPGLARFWRHLYRGAAAYVVLLIALLLTGLAYYYVRQNVETQNRARFEEATQTVEAAISRRVARHFDAMYGASGLLLVSNSLGREQWDDYVKVVTGIEPKRFWWKSGFQSLGFAKYVRPGEREAYSREASKEGARDLWPKPNGERSAYFPLEFVAPSSEANRAMLGYDAYSDPAYQSAMEGARDNGTLEVTRMDYVLTDAPSHSEADLDTGRGFVVYFPVYQKSEPTGTVAERRRALRGFVVGTFRADKLFGGAFGKHRQPAIDFEVYDGEDVASSSLVYDYNGVTNAEEKGNAPLFSKKSSFDMTGHEWTLYFATLPAFEEGIRSDLPAFVLVSGLAVSFLLFGITWMLARSRSQAVHASADLKEANQELQRSRESLVSAREEERRRLSRDVHDGVGPQLAALMLGLETASDLVSDVPEASGLMAKLSRHAGQIVSDVRRSVHALRPPALDELGLIESLREGAIQYEQAGLHVSVEGPEELPQLPAAVEVACFTIVQEALANVVRHARASHCSIRIRLDEEAEAVIVEVEDDGRGIRDDDRAGVGTISMHERTEELGGWCTVKRLAGGGTLVRVLLPFQATKDVRVQRNERA
jgi:signal transduction histidine kinase